MLEIWTEKTSDEVAEGMEELYSDDDEYPYADKPKQLIYSRNYVKSESSVVTSNVGEDQSSKVSEGKPDGQMFMFMVGSKTDESASETETDLTWYEIGDYGEINRQKRTLRTGEEKVRKRCFDMLCESMRGRYDVKMHPETMEICIDGEKLEDFYKNFSEVKGIQKIIERWVENILMVAETYVRSRKPGDPTLIIEELGEEIVQPMAEHCAKVILARQKGETAPSNDEIWDIQEKAVTRYTDRYLRMRAEKDPRWRRECKENDLEESLNQTSDGDESYVTARSHFSRSVSRESRRLFTNNGVDEGPSSSKCERRDDSKEGRRFREKMERSQKIFDLKQHGCQHPKGNFGVKFEKRYSEANKRFRTH